MQDLMPIGIVAGRLAGGRRGKAEVLKHKPFTDFFRSPFGGGAAKSVWRLPNLGANSRLEP
jgi:hypothetical protein